MNWLFSIEATADPQVLPRVAGYFAQRWIVPSTSRLQLQDGVMFLEFSIDVLEQCDAEIIAAKLRENALIMRVVLTR